MTFPSGAETVTVSIGPIESADGRDDVSGTVTVTPSAATTHTPSGVHFPANGRVYPVRNGLAEVELLASDAADCTVTRYYTFTFSLTDRDGGTVSVASRTVFLEAVTPTVDLELLADTEIVDGTPVSIAAVTSVAGRTGAVSAAQLVSDVETWSARPTVNPAPHDRIGWDDFGRRDTTTTLGVSSCGQAWHDSSNMRIYRGAAQRVSGIGVRATAAHFNPGRRNIRASVIANTPASGDFDCGFVLRSTSNTSNRMLFVVACDSTSTVKLFGRTPSADNQLASASVSFSLGQRYLFEVQDLDDTIKFFVDGTEVLSYTLDDVDTFITVGATPYTESEYYADLYDIGLTAHHTRDNFTRFENFQWWNLRARTLDFPVTIAHRGAVAGAPENSLRSLARVPRGVYAAEVDVRQTSDGVWVCMHDATVDRTTDGSGTVSAMTSAQIAALTLDGGGGPVPTLADWLDAANGLGFDELWIDYGSGTVSSLTALLSAHAAASRVVVFVSSVAEATSVRSAWAGARISIGSVTVANVASVVSGATTVTGVETLLITPGDADFVTNVAAVADILAGGFVAGASTISLSDTLVAARAAGVTTVLNDYAHMIN